jgi:nitrogen fixation NifU-like protein
VVLYLDIEDGKVADLRIDGQGCSISQSSASMMSAAVKGKSLDEVASLTRSFKAMMSIHETSIGGDGTETEIDPAEGAVDGDGTKLGDLEALRGVVKFPVRIKCATLSWNTLAQGIAEATNAHTA